MPHCPICKVSIQPSDSTATCSECDSRYHQECWNYNGGCAAYGCKAAPVLEKPPLPSVISRGWGDEKVCPKCFNTIASSLTICRCGARFPYADPMTHEAYEAWLSEEAERRRSRRTLMGLFLVSLLGLPAPITGAAAGLLAYQRRKELAGEGGPFLALGYGTAAVGAIYCLTFILLLLRL